MIRLGLNRKMRHLRNSTLLADCIDMIFEQGNPAGINKYFILWELQNNTVRLPLVSVDESLSDN
jgi:4-hydroxy-tetrahydrodipicolinate synthase